MANICLLFYHMPCNVRGEHLKKACDQTAKLFPCSPHLTKVPQAIFEASLNFLSLLQDLKTFHSRREQIKTLYIGYSLVIPATDLLVLSSGDKVWKTKWSCQPAEVRPAAPASDCLLSGQLVDPPLCGCT